MGSKRLLGIFAAIALALVGTGLIAAYVNSAEDRALAGEEVVEVLVIDKLVKAGATPEEVEAATRIERVPSKVRADAALVNFDSLAGQVTAIDLVPGEQVVASRFIDEVVFAAEESKLTVIPPGYHEVTIALEPHRAVGGELRPGDSVGVIASFDPMPTNGAAGVRWVDTQKLREALDLGIDLATIGAWFGTESENPEGETDNNAEEEDPATGFNQNVVVDDIEAFVQAAELVISLDGSLPFEARQTPAVTHLLVHKVLVTRVQLEEPPQSFDSGDDEDASDLAPTGRLLVTLALPTEDIESVVFSAEFGRIWLSNEPQDAPEAGTAIVNRENIYLDTEDDDLVDREVTGSGDPAFSVQGEGQ